MSEQQFRVRGRHPVLGRAPGETVRASEVPDQEQLARMIARGSLEPIVTTKSKAGEPAGGKEH